MQFQFQNYLKIIKKESLKITKFIDTENNYNDIILMPNNRCGGLTEQGKASLHKSTKTNLLLKNEKPL